MLEQKRQDNIIGVLATVFFHGLLLFFLLYHGYQKIYPPPGEEGILINFGTTQTGQGAEEPMVAQPVQVPPQLPQAPHEEQPNLTQDYEAAPAIKQPRRKKKEQPKLEKRQVEQPQTQPQPTQPLPEKPVEKPREVNRSALFPGQGTATAQGHGEAGGSGNQGSPNGSSGGSPSGTGLGLSGSGANLEGRSLVGTLPEPEYPVQTSGKVIVRIKVNSNGDVVEAKADSKGSTLMDATLYAAAERAARRAKFTSAPGSMSQSGIITYVFKLGQ